MAGQSMTRQARQCEGKASRGWSWNGLEGQARQARKGMDCQGTAWHSLAGKDGRSRSCHSMARQARRGRDWQAGHGEAVIGRSRHVMARQAGQCKGKTRYGWAGLGKRRIVRTEKRHFVLTNNEIV